MKHRWLPLLLGLLFLSPAAHAQSADNLLPPHQAFKFSAKAVGPDTVHVHWTVADGYYMYRKRIKLHADTPGVKLGDFTLPEGKVKHDEFVGDVQTYRHQLDVDIPVQRKAGAPRTFQLVAVSQGCADAGVCYPPLTDRVKLTLPQPPAQQAASAASPGANPGGGALNSVGGGLGGAGGGEFLEPDKAFRFSTRVAGPDTVVAHWKIADKYYLYRSKFKFSLADAKGVTLGAVDLPQGQTKDDEFLGRVQVFHHRAEARLPLNRTESGPTTVDLKVTYQGCAEAGICYPPMHKTVALKLPAAGGGGGGAAGTTRTPPEPAGASGQTPATPAPPVSEQDRLAQLLTTSPLWLSLGIFFGLGVGLAFTPCVFPMIPILSSIVVGQGERITTLRAFTLSVVYVLAMAVTYTAAGVLVAEAGQNIQAMFQNPWILSSFAALFVVLSLSMFGFYDLQMPGFLQSKLSEISNRQQGGTLIGVAIMGFLSALIVGPCVAAPLAGALLVIGQTGDAVLGGSALFALSLGMGVPLLVVGTGAGQLLPRAGDWMKPIKAVFGVLLLAVAIWMLERILPGPVTMILWAALLMVSSIFMGALDSLGPDATGWRRFWKGTGLVMLIYGGVLLIGATAGGSDPFQPLHRFAVTSGPGAQASASETGGHLDFRRVKSVADVRQAVAATARQNRPAMLDFYADWCVSCKEMEKYTFSKPQVRKALDNAVLLQADVTDNTVADKALLKHFGLIGPPSILFFGPDGQERRGYRVVGFMNASKFAAHVEKATRER